MLRLGLIGLSQGNGHPYSWGAIINGYNQSLMEDCGFPVIPKYLAQEKWPEARIKDSCVTHLWTQDLELSKKIADTVYIETVVQRPEEMLGKIDALLLARDDAEMHFEFASPFIKAGIPVYIDKPIALSVKELNELYKLERFPGQIFSCSALRYSQDLTLKAVDAQKIGTILEIFAFSPKSWDKYAVHLIEPILKLIDAQDCILKSYKHIGKLEARGLTTDWQSGIRTNIFTTGVAICPISMRILGSDGWHELFFADPFLSFKAALLDFINSIRQNRHTPNFAFNKRVINILEQGR